MKSRFYTAQEVAEMLGVHQSTAYKIIKSGAFIALHYAFAYGMMCGKRLERAKKHR